MEKAIAIAIGKGLLTYIPYLSTVFIRKRKKKSRHSCSDALFCYTLWFRTLNYLKKNNLPLKFQSLAEIGSGGSLGIAFCALLTGSDKYIALEIENNFNMEENLALFEEILLLFKTNKRIPDIDVYDGINIKTQEYKYYSEIIDQKEFNEYLSPNRIDQIRTSILTRNNKNISIINDWEENMSASERVDFIFSRAVMEHVNDPFSINKSSYKILNDNGILLHDIEFHSHNITKDWHKHYEINRFIWKIIKGRRKYYLNRYKYYDHVLFIERNNFKIIDKNIVEKEAYKKGPQIYGAVILAKKE